MPKFEERLIALRKERNLTQEALANKIGVTPQSVSKWETGQSMPDINLLTTLADFFQVSIDYLLGRIDNQDINSKKPSIYIVIKEKSGEETTIRIPLLLAKFLGKKMLKISGQSIEGIDWNDVMEEAKNGYRGELISIKQENDEEITILIK